MKENAQAHQKRNQDDLRVGVDPGDPFGAHEARAASALHHEEVDDGRDGKAAVDAADAAVDFLEVKGEDQAGDVLHDHARYEGDDHRNENARDHRERPGC